MSNKLEACSMRTQNCLPAHGNRINSTALVSSFFKVLIGDDFPTVLFFPPKFGPTVSSLNGRETFLEDSSGQRWKVKVSILEDSFVLQEGWSAFVSEHGLELGDFLIFNYFMGSHFEVHIYDKSACERLDFSARKNQKERNDNATQTFTTEDGQCLTKCKGSTSQHGSRTSNVDGMETCDDDSKLKNDVGKAKIVTKDTPTNNNETITEKTVSIAKDTINRDIGKNQEEYRGTVVDLSKLKLLKNNLGNQGSNKITAGNKKLSHLARTSFKSQKEAGLGNIESQDKGQQSTRVPLGGSAFKMGRGGNGSDKGSKLVAVSDKNSGTKHKVIKLKRRQSPNSPSRGHGKAYGVGKLETLDVDTNPSSIAANISSLMVANSEPYLELPTPLPSSPVGTRKKRKTDKFSGTLMRDGGQYSTKKHQDRKL